MYEELSCSTQHPMRAAPSKFCTTAVSVNLCQTKASVGDGVLVVMTLMAVKTVARFSCRCRCLVIHGFQVFHEAAAMPLQSLFICREHSPHTSDAASCLEQNFSNSCHPWHKFGRHCHCHDYYGSQDCHVASLVIHGFYFIIS